MFFYNNKGITLVSIIVTIIVMLIIAGVSIRAITGEDSSTQKAKYAKETEEYKSALDSIEQALIKYHSGNYIGNKTVEQVILENVDNSKSSSSAGKNYITVKLGETDYKFEIYEDPNDEGYYRAKYIESDEYKELKEN